MDRSSAAVAVRAEKPSFAKIAATGLKTTPILSRKPLESLTNPQAEKAFGSFPATTNGGSPADPSPQHLASIVPLANVGMEGSLSNNNSSNAPIIDVTAVEKTGKPRAGARITTNLAADDLGTRASPSNYSSARPPSLDGKSTASGTTFALDEKESLRPDDSASVNAVDDEEIFAPPGPDIRQPRADAQENMRAFRQQLHDISSLDTRGLGSAEPGYGFGPPMGPGVLYVPPVGPGVGNVSDLIRRDGIAVIGDEVQPDPKLLEALDSPRDRIWVLKLEQDIFDFVKDPKEASLNLPQCNAYHRMLAHKIADYYMLGHVVDDSASAVRLFKTPNCRVPPPLTGITTPSTAASTPPPAAPQMKILRRGNGNAGPGGSNYNSKTTSENDESGNEDEKKRLPASREEREARYEAARLRIMGSAKPVESPEPVKEKDESRSSSTAGKKTKKKQRSDSEDGFEARSAYSAYYSASYGPNTFVAAPHGMQTFSDASPLPPPSPGVFGPQQGPAGYPFTPQNHGPPVWPSGGTPGPYHESHNWPPVSHQGYDLSHDFHRSMSFQGSPMARQPSAPSPFVPSQSPYAPQPSPNQQYFGGGPQQQWQSPLQPSYPPIGPPQTMSYGHNAQYGSRPQSSSSQGLDGQPYQYGQLPSEAFPGRPSNKLEHPLPGSYKGKHFNPQSQAFVPNQPGIVRPMTPKATPTPIGFNSSTPMPNALLQRHASLPSPSSYHVHQQHGSSPGLLSARMSQPMIHPLPQPVFPQQPSPSVSLPLKPNGPTNVARAGDDGASSPSAFGAGSGLRQSTIAKWGTPASLPAKPPPSNEPFDPARYPQLARQTSYNSAVSAARMPNLVGGYPVVNGSSVTSAKRA